MGKRQKEMVTWAKVVVNGRPEKPYYGIEYYSVLDRRVHSGFGSFDINYVLKWMCEEFEFVHTEDVILFN